VPEDFVESVFLIVGVVVRLAGLTGSTRGRTTLGLGTGRGGGVLGRTMTGGWAVVPGCPFGLAGAAPKAALATPATAIEPRRKRRMAHPFVP
jgi:hypothetical protein